MIRGWSFLNIVILALVTLGVSRLEAAPQPIKRITINYNGLTWTAETQATDIAETLIEQLGEYDGLTVIPNPESKINDGTTIVISDTKKQALTSVVAVNLDRSHQAQVIATKPAVAKPTAPIQSGFATWYRFGDKLTAASRKYPKGTTLRVVTVASGKSVDVVVNDYGPSPLTGIDLDLNMPAFEKIAPLGAGKIKVKYYKL